MADIVHIDDYRPAVCYTVHFTHGYDGSLEMCVEDADDDHTSQIAVATALFRGAQMIASSLGITVEELMNGGVTGEKVGAMHVSRET